MSHVSSVPTVVALLAILTLPAGATEPPLGELPAGAISVYEVRDVVAEICRRHVFAPEAAALEMPAGFRLARLSELSSAPWIAELQQRRPDLRDRAHGSLCFIEANTHTVDGAPLYSGRRSRFAFLWADVVPTGPAPADPRFVGRVRRAQLFLLYDAEGVDRGLALRATPDALFGRITMEKVGETWHVGIAGDDSVLTAEVKATTARRRLDYPMPGFETVLRAGGARDHFHVVTFAGHHEQLAAGAWQASGTAVWARGFAGEAVDAGSFVQDGFAARLGLYPQARP